MERCLELPQPSIFQISGDELLGDAGHAEADGGQIHQKAAGAQLDLGGQLQTVLQEESRKIQAAKMLLAETQKTVEQIAEETGFCDSSYFCKIFKRFESITPSQFRNAEQVL